MSSHLGDEDLVQEVKISKISKHPKYIHGVAYFDVAVLDVEPVEFTETVRPVCLRASRGFRVDRYEQVSKLEKVRDGGTFGGQWQPMMI